MKYSLYLVSALMLIACVSAGGYSNNSPNHHHHHHKKNGLDDLKKEILNFGINFIFEDAAERYGVSDDNVEVTKVNSWEKIPGEGSTTLYRFNVDATNNDDATVEADFGVEYNRDTKEMTMGKWDYTIHFIGENEFGESANEEDNFETGVDEGTGAGSEPEPEPEPEAEIEMEADIETGIDEEGTDDNNEDFEEVPQDEIDNDDVIQGVLQDGAAFIFNRAADRFGVSNNPDDIEITDVESVERRAGQNTTTYRINIDATNNDDATVEARLTIEHDNQSGENTVGPWRYSIRYRIFENDEGGSLEEESILEFDMNDGLNDIL